MTDDGLAVLVTVTESCDPVNKVFKFDLAADGSMPAAAVARAGGNTAVTKWVDDFGAEFEYVGKRKVYRKDRRREREGGMQMYSHPNTSLCELSSICRVLLRVG